eukprot:g31738.t1
MRVASPGWVSSGPPWRPAPGPIVCCPGASRLAPTSCWSCHELFFDTAGVSAGDCGGSAMLCDNRPGTYACALGQDCRSWGCPAGYQCAESPGGVSCTCTQLVNFDFYVGSYLPVGQQNWILVDTSTYSPPFTAYSCPKLVNKTNWLGGYTYTHQFRITTNFNNQSQLVEIYRLDALSGWNFNLGFVCQRHAAGAPGEGRHARARGLGGPGRGGGQLPPRQEWRPPCVSFPLAGLPPRIRCPGAAHRVAAHGAPCPPAARLGRPAGTRRRAGAASLPLWPLLTEDGAALQEPDLLVEDEWPAPLCLDERMHDICAQWAHRPLQLLRLRDGRIGYAAELPLNAPDRQAAEAKFRSVLARWLRPFRKTVANLNKSYEFWKSTEVVLDRRPPYLLKLPRRVVPLAGAGHEGTEPECRFRWQQLGWDRELRWSDDEARDRRVLTLRSLLVGALGVLDARLNPIVSAGGEALLYSGQADVGGHEHTALRRLCVALSLLRELDPGWHCPGKLCPVSIHLGFGVWPHTYHYGDRSGPEPQVPETDFTVYVCSSHEHAFLLCKQRADNAVKLTLWDPNGSRSGTYRLLQHVCRGLALRDQHGERLARLLGLAEAGLTEASLGCYVYPRETPTLQGDEGSCTTHALLLAAVAVVEGPDRLPRQGAQDLSDAWLLLGSALGWRWCLPPEARARMLFLPPAETDDAGADDFQETAVLRAP